MAHDICRDFYDRLLLQVLCSACPAFWEGPGAEGPGPDTVGAAVCYRPGHSDAAVHLAEHSGGQRIQRRADIGGAEDDVLKQKILNFKFKILNLNQKQS